MANIGQLFVRGAVIAREQAQQSRSLQRKVENLAKDKEFLQQQVASLSFSMRRGMISRKAEMPITQQCRLLGVARSTIYYQPIGISAENQRLMRLIDEMHLAWPFLGSRNIQDMLRDKQGLRISRKRVRRLMRAMGLTAIYQKPRLSKRGKVTRSTHTCCAT